MKFLSFGVLAFALAFCGLGDRLKEMTGTTTTSSNTANAPANSTAKPGKTESGGAAEVPKPTAAQQAIMDGASEIKWDDQGITWKVPDGWNKMDVKKEMFNYGSPKTGFLIGSISVMPGNFPADVSLKATYDSSLEQLKNGKYENVRWLEIDGVKGVEWVEAMPEEKDSPRRHQWIAFRNYQGQNQQLNIMLSTDGSKFNERKDTFAAIMYSMKIAK